MSNVYNIVDTQVYSGSQIINRRIALEHKFQHLGAGATFKTRQRTGKWYLTVKLETVGENGAMWSIVDEVKKVFPYSYSTSGSMYDRIFRIGSTSNRDKQQRLKARDSTKAAQFRSDVFQAVYAATWEPLDFDVDLITEVADNIAGHLLDKYDPKFRKWHPTLLNLAQLS